MESSLLTTTMPQSYTASSHHDDWARMESVADRRKVQNRLAQRKYSKMRFKPGQFDARDTQLD